MMVRRVRLCRISPKPRPFSDTGSVDAEDAFGVTGDDDDDDAHRRPATVAAAPLGCAVCPRHARDADSSVEEIGRMDREHFAWDGAEAVNAIRGNDESARVVTTDLACVPFVAADASDTANLLEAIDRTIMNVEAIFGVRLHAMQLGWTIDMWSLKCIPMYSALI
eukprot:Opistho-2@65235